MLTLHRYISRELLRAFLIAFLVLMLIIFVGFALRYMHEGLDIIEMKFIFPHLAMQSFPYSVPLSLLLAVIMTYGRLSGDNEITALRSSGIHLQTIVTPTMLIAVFFSIFMFFVISRMLPYSEREVREIMLDAKTWTRALKVLGKSAKRIRLRGWLIYVMNQDEGGAYQGISIYKVSQEFVSEMWDAKRGRIDIDEDSGIARLHLESGIFTKANYDRPEDVKTMHFESFDVCIPINQTEGLDEFHDPKFLSLPQLRRSQAKLKERIKTHAQKFSDPLAASKEWGAKRDEIGAENNRIFSELVEAQGSLSRIDKQQKKSERELADCERSRKEYSAAVAAAKKQWQRLKQELDTKIDELSRKNEEQQKLLEKLKPSEDNGGETEENAALDDEDARTLRTLNRDIAGLNDMKLRLEEEVQKAKEAYESTREVLDNVDKRITDLKFALEQCSAAKAALLVSVGEKSKDLEEGKEEVEHAHSLSCQAAEQQEEYELRITINERLALSFSCLAFVMAAVPLGIYSRHGHVLIALAIGLALVLLYFGMFMVGSLLAQSRYLPCEVSIWSADIGLATLGATLLIGVFRK